MRDIAINTDSPRDNRLFDSRYW